MDTIKVFLPFFLNCLLFAIMVTGEDKCLPLRCSRSEPLVQFPFSLGGHDRHERCSYPGFDLSCDKNNRTVLELGTSGKFLVRRIDYIAQEVEIYDQDNCLAKRVLNLNTSSSYPIKFFGSQPVYLFNCSNVSSKFIEPIDCLSTSNYTVFAAYGTSQSSDILDNCELVGSGMMPTWKGKWFRDVSEINDDIHLYWDSPDCGKCVAQGGNCTFTNLSIHHKQNYQCSLQSGLSRRQKYGLGMGLGIPGLICVLLIGCCIFGRFKSNDGNNHNFTHIESSSTVLPQPPIPATGLNESVIRSYPKTVLGESRRLVKPEDNTCTICLSEYKTKETVKTIPYCKHQFHAVCLDEWLRRNATCPLCRKSPISSV